MYRYFIEELKKWKGKKNRKPLIIEGARQVGKTWIMKEFGRTCYDDAVYINFDGNSTMKALFEGDLDVRRIVRGLEVYVGKKIVAGKTLLIFDEVQEVPKALGALKYFNEDASEYDIVCAGSLLGIALHGGTSFPVGKVEFLRLYPLNFEEFLLALGKNELVELIHSGDFDTLNAFKSGLERYLKEYYFVGGMPEVVREYAETGDFFEVRNIQKRILEAYEQDFSKHAPTDVVPRIRMVWNSIVSQLAKENKKFVYGILREGARAKDYETAIMWLCDCGLVYKINRVNSVGIPLKAYEDGKSFKLFVVDVGLLGCMANVSPGIILQGSDIFVEYKGAMTEQYVLQQMLGDNSLRIYYFTNDRSSCEIDFVLDVGERIVPLEVKAELNLRAKSLNAFIEKFNPDVAVRTSMADYKSDGKLIDLPLYAVGNIGALVKK